MYISSNQFTLVSNLFQYAKIRVLSKAQLFAGGALNYTDFTGMRNADNSLAFTLQPARGLSSVSSGYFLNSRSSTGSNVTLWRLDTPLSSPSLTRQATVAVGAYSIPPDAPQQNTGTLIATTMRACSNSPTATASCTASSPNPSPAARPCATCALTLPRTRC